MRGTAPLAELWRTDPAGYAERLTRGAYRRWPHIRYISRRIADAIRTGGARLLISTPPQFGKSLLAAAWTPLWAVDRDPSRKVLVLSYGAELAARSVRYARDQIVENESLLTVRLGKAAEDYFETRSARGSSVAPGYVRAAGITGGVTGYGADLVVLDDLYANLEEANSPTHRQKVEELIWSVVMTRLSKTGSVVGIMTRWHDEDAFGVLARKGWEHIRLPALAEEDDPLGRAPGESLCEDHKPRAWLEEMRAATLPRVWQSVYQGRPVRETGSMFRRSWWQTVPAAPEAGRVVARLRYWDTAGSKNERKGDPDYAVGGIMSILDTRAIVVEEIDRDRGTTFDCERRIIAAANRDGKAVPIHIGQEPGDAGLHYINSIARALPGWIVRPHRETGDKVARARPFASQLEAGNVSMVRAAWNAALLDELDTFPTGDHDDIVDCLSGAFACLTNGVRVSNPDGAAKPERPRPTQSDAEPDYDAADRPVAPHERLFVGTFGGSAVPVISSRKAQRWQW